MQWPQPELSPNEVIMMVFDALQQNDDPQLDHGCLVLLEMASEGFDARRRGLNPAQFGRVLRQDPRHEQLVGFVRPMFIGEQQQVSPTCVRQTVRLTGHFRDADQFVDPTEERDYVVQLSQQPDDRCWRIDSIERSDA